MDRTSYVNRILETENLTDNLEDDEANVLLDWGLGRLDLFIGAIDDEEVAGTQVSALMNIMRTINRIIGNFPDPSPDGLRELLTLSDLLSKSSLHGKWQDFTFATTLNADEIDFEAIAAQLTSMTPVEALSFLLTWISPPESTNSSVEQGE